MTVLISEIGPPGRLATKASFSSFRAIRSVILREGQVVTERVDEKNGAIGDGDDKITNAKNVEMNFECYPWESHFIG